MNILVIGNGFDIAHDLPTSYKDFLQFTDIFLQFTNFQKKTLEKDNTKEKQLIQYFTELFSKRDIDDNAKQVISELGTLIKDNRWIEYFKNVNIAQGWIDFEKEIAKIIITLDEVRNKTIKGIKRNGRGETLINSEREIIELLLNGSCYRFFSDEEPINELKDHLLNDLKRLIRCLEIYLCDYVQKIQIERRLLDIEKLDIDAVVSFNYTDTYRKNYTSNIEKNIEYDFVHGKAEIQNTIETCNMVIGIDEYLEGAARETDNEFIEFKKFFQRIYKGCGTKYLDWIEESSEATIGEDKIYPALNIYIYGHSLDITDKDILSKLIMSKNANTTIFYHNREAFKNQIINLTKIITEEELIRRTGGMNRSIIFKPTNK